MVLSQLSNEMFGIKILVVTCPIPYLIFAKRDKCPRMFCLSLVFLSLACRDEDDYLPGNILEIELCNFMTFTTLVQKPGSRLNLVIGPNGSGKSSLVCAIALGLGGDPQVTKPTCFSINAVELWVFSCDELHIYRFWGGRQALVHM